MSKQNESSEPTRRSTYVEQGEAEPESPIFDSLEAEPDPESEKANNVVDEINAIAQGIAKWAPEHLDELSAALARQNFYLLSQEEIDETNRVHTENEQMRAQIADNEQLLKARMEVIDSQAQQLKDAGITLTELKAADDTANDEPSEGVTAAAPDGLGDSLAQAALFIRQGRAGAASVVHEHLNRGPIERAAHIETVRVVTEILSGYVSELGRYTGDLIGAQQMADARR